MGFLIDMILHIRSFGEILGGSGEGSQEVILDCACRSLLNFQVRICLPIFFKRYFISLYINQQKTQPKNDMRSMCYIVIPQDYYAFMYNPVIVFKSHGTEWCGGSLIHLRFLLI
jgi:hypothetical protein